MKLRNISVYENRGEYGKGGIGFIFEAFSMTALYEKFLPLIETDNIRKIIITCGTIHKQKEIAGHLFNFKSKRQIENTLFLIKENALHNQQFFLSNVQLAHQ